MPRRLAWKRPGKVEVLEYQDRELQEDEVLVKTEYASGKHGTTLALFENVNFEGKRFTPRCAFFSTPMTPVGLPVVSHKT